MAAKPRTPVARSVKTPAALTALRGWLGRLDEGVRQRGAKYAEEGRVKAVWADADHYVSADVEGGEPYEVTLFYTRGEWNSRCTCPVAVGCKHACAAALTWIAAVESGAADRDELTPDATAAAAAAERAALVTAAVLLPAAELPPPVVKSEASFRAKWEPVLAKKLGRALKPDEARQLEALSALFTEFGHRHRMLFPDTLRRHGFGFLIPPGGYAGPLFAGWWDHDTAPGDPWALWQYLAYEIERMGGTIPPLFRPLTDTSRIEAALVENSLRKEIDDWREEMLRGDAGPVEVEREGLPAFAGIRARFSAEGWLYIETRVAEDKPWRTPPPTWFRALANAYPADFAHLPPAEAALGVVLALECRQRPQFFAGRRALPLEVLTPVLADRLARGAVLLPGGRPFAVEAEALVREAQVADGEPDRLEFRLVTPEGEDAGEARLLVKRPEPLYLFENRVWRGPAPIPRKRLPIAALSDTRIMSRLRAGGLRLPREIEGKMRRVVLQPSLSLWLEEASRLPHDGQRLQAELTARADAPPAAQTWQGGRGWQWASGQERPVAKPGEAPIEFDLSAAQPTTAVLPEFRLEWTEWTGTWTRAVTKNFPEEFAAWHATLPPELAVELAPELADIVAPPLRAHVDFEATPAGVGKDWFDLTIALRVEDTTLTEEEIALLLKARGKWVRLENRGWRRLELTGAGDEQAATLDRLGLGVDDVLAGGKAVTHRLHALQLASEAASFAARDAKLAAELRARIEKLAAIPKPPLPAGLRATLRPYQEEGFHFLAHLSALGFGGVLADDMGLGKTVQTLAWLLHLAAEPRPEGKTFRALVVCPKSVTHGWLAETERFAPELRAVAFTPTLAYKKVGALKVDLVVANYTQMRLQAAWFQSGAWDAVVLDEGQFIKNPTSQAAAVARALPSRHRVVLTGTPIENRLMDLWSLFAFAQPGLLGGQAAFRRQYSEDVPEARARLRRRVGHFLLRRTKAQAAPDLPPRTEDDLVVELEGPQRKLYEAELKRARAHLLGVETSSALDKVRFNVLASLLRLRQICCHPALIDPAHRDLPSAKLDALMERLEELRDEGHQVLVFSQFVEMLEIIRDRLNGAGIAHLMLTGATENRAQLVEQFQTDRSKTVFLLSLKAAGFGLNLTAASYAILYDPWWNPAVEAQAIDRTHRIGQTRPVMAYRLIAAETVEQKIRALQQEKTVLAASVVQEETLASVMDLESLRRILA